MQQVVFRCSLSTGRHQNVARTIPLCANYGLIHRSIMQFYSITSLALASRDDGMVMSNALAVLRLMISRNLVA